MKNVLENGTVSRDGAIRVNDRIVSINGEDLRNTTSYQARYAHFSIIILNKTSF